ncbi:4-oxalocrotonate tautomerase [Clostridiales bacterium PH28_bin88]|nr:4-oxalocrotonate tautomerase [Clostridiales bacterium PH28_bin88]
MPIITIEMLEGRTLEQKRELAEAITREVSRITNAPPEAVSIIIREMPTTNFSKAGRLRYDVDEENTNKG